MAISSPHYRIVSSIANMLPRGGTLLEIGEANWYGDIEPRFPCRDNANGFQIAKDFYAATFAPSRIVSVDMNGSESALRLDLNYPLPMEEQFDVVINHGTAEHIFNIFQVFKTMHDHCELSGLMFHESPFSGWVDHGFYCIHPTLYYDLAAANNYEVCRIYVTAIAGDVAIPVESRDCIYALAKSGTIPENAMLFVVLRKLFDCQFRVPVQGYYSRRLSAAGFDSWVNLR